MEEKLDIRPKPRIWTGQDYESDDDVEMKPRGRSFNIDSESRSNANPR